MVNFIGPFGTALGACIAASLLTGLIRHWAIRREILDHPNERSSHSSPTPRGGGMAIVVSVLAWLVWAGTTHYLDWKTVIAIGVGGAIVAIVGWLDDVRSLSVRTRLVCHFLAASWAVWWLGGLPVLSVGSSSATLGISGGVLAVIGVVWATNLFNFMDGIDGIAAVECLSIGAIGGALLLAKSSPGLATLSLVMAGSALGFLFWNWAPAKIFLGDVGSGFIGFVFAALAIVSENAGAMSVMVWAILAAVFVVDATLTFGRRFRAGFWRDAHRSHAYQRAVQGGWTHAAVTGAVGLMNLLLGALAAAAAMGRIPLLAAVLLALALVGAVYAAVGQVQPFRVERKYVAPTSSGGT